MVRTILGCFVYLCKLLFARKVSESVSQILGTDIK